MKVLVTTDGSCFAATGMRTAIRVLNPEDRNLDVLCVVPSYNLKDETAGRERYEQRTLTETTKILEQARLRIAQPNESAGCHRVEDSAGVERCRRVPFAVAAAKRG